ncbi:hypothetical protein M0E87_10865 [Corynebacterium sp. CCM 9185]|uniref:CorA-like Mg2+ transporter protein n=1 Tax=Corynebacterium marambiense TaxID=2765364 RepID=A0ABS0VUE9_9CORY|nr:hypothetical protein [Corynebacterium marambiense]MBI9000400.1 hypothetical protein [Corynebacterium marambiense]MCK7664151.1 hypothetical protein [Corynebacterium marambiense]
MDSINQLIPHCIGRWRLRGVELYVPRSGFAVIRYRMACKQVNEDTLAPAVAGILLDRVEEHANLQAKGVFLEHEDVDSIVRLLRDMLHSRAGINYRLNGSEPVHTYAVSCFSLVGMKKSWRDIDRCLAALQWPRKVGCTTSVDQSELPDSEELSECIRRLKLADGVVFREALDRGIEIRATWSSVVGIEYTGTSYVLLHELISCCEYRVQSTWLAAHQIAEAAWSSENSGGRFRSPAHVEFIASDFHRLVSGYRGRIGTDSPDRETRALLAVARSSEVEFEIEQAEAAIEALQHHSNLIQEKRSRSGRLLLESLALIFAASGLAGLLFPLPITREVIFSEPYLFGGWLMVIFIGIWAVWRNQW